MVGVYFSGTGNTKLCVEHFVQQLNERAECFSIEDIRVINEILKHDEIVFGYPVYYSNLPKIVKDFLYRNSEIWSGKRIYIMATMGLFSGDGAGVAARLVKKYKAVVTGGLHLKMPDCIVDVKVLKKSAAENRKIIQEAKSKVEQAAALYKAGKPMQEGLNIGFRLAGLFGQRLYFRNMTAKYSDKLKIDSQRCIGCGRCASLCPMKNIVIQNGKAVPKDLCTMCYRCVNNCPRQAITLLGRKVLMQYKIEDAGL